MALGIFSKSQIYSRFNCSKYVTVYLWYSIPNVTYVALIVLIQTVGRVEQMG